MGTIQIGAYRGSLSGPMVADLTSFATSAVMTANLHGSRDLTISAPRLLAEALQLYTSAGLVLVAAHDNGRRCWIGRLSAPDLYAGENGSGITLRALGLWEALNDLEYTTLWSDTRTALWSEMTALDFSSAAPERYELKADNRLFIAPRKNEVFDSSGLLGVWKYERPHNSRRQISRVTFDYTLIAPVNWQAAFQIWSGTGTTAWSFVSSEWTLSGNGAVQTGSQAINLSSAADRIAFRLYYNAASATYTNETGAVYLSITNIHVMTTTSTTITADQIASDLVAAYNSYNANIISTSTARITNPGADFVDLQFEDTPFTTVLNTAATRGDGVGTIYVTGIDCWQQLYLHPIGTSGRTWYVDITNLELSSDRTTLANQVVAIYEDASGRTLRTTDSTDSTSVAQYGYTRRRSVDAKTTNTTVATQYRDATISDTKIVRPAAAISFTVVYNSAGGNVPLAEVAPGDTLVIRNIPLTNTLASIDRIRSFMITETEYNILDGVLSVTPESPLPLLEVLIAQNAIGV